MRRSASSTGFCGYDNIETLRMRHEESGMRCRKMEQLLEEKRQHLQAGKARLHQEQAQFRQEKVGHSRNQQQCQHPELEQIGVQPHSLIDCGREKRGDQQHQWELSTEHLLQSLSQQETSQVQHLQLPKQTQQSPQRRNLYQSLQQQELQQRQMQHLIIQQQKQLRQQQKGYHEQLLLLDLRQESEFQRQKRLEDQFQQEQLQKNKLHEEQLRREQQTLEQGMKDEQQQLQLQHAEQLHQRKLQEESLHLEEQLRQQHLRESKRQQDEQFLQQSRREEQLRQQIIREEHRQQEEQLRKREAQRQRDEQFRRQEVKEEHLRQQILRNEHRQQEEQLRRQKLREERCQRDEQLRQRKLREHRLQHEEQLRQQRSYELQLQPKLWQESFQPGQLDDELFLRRGGQELSYQSHLQRQQIQREIQKQDRHFRGLQQCGLPWQNHGHRLCQQLGDFSQPQPASPPRRYTEGDQANATRSPQRLEQPLRRPSSQLSKVETSLVQLLQKEQAELLAERARAHQASSRAEEALHSAEALEE